MIVEIKIDNGYIVPVNNIKELKDFSSKFRLIIREESKRIITEKIAKKCVSLMDFVSLPEDKKSFFTQLEPIDKSKSPLYLAYENLFIQEREKKNPEYNFLCDLIFFPLEECTLAILFPAQSSYIDLFESIDGVIKYDYSEDKNNTPENIKKKELWKKAIGDTGIPSLEGFLISCYIEVPNISIESIIECMNNINIDDRAKNIANKILIYEKYKNLRKTYPQKNPQDLYEESKLIIFDDNSYQQLLKEKESISKELKKEFTVDNCNQTLDSLI